MIINLKSISIWGKKCNAIRKYFPYDVTLSYKGKCGEFGAECGMNHYKDFCLNGFGRCGALSALHPHHSEIAIDITTNWLVFENSRKFDLEYRFWFKNEPDYKAFLKASKKNHLPINDNSLFIGINRHYNMWSKKCVEVRKHFPFDFTFIVKADRNDYFWTLFEDSQETFGELQDNPLSCYFGDPGSFIIDPSRNWFGYCKEMKTFDNVKIRLWFKDETALMMFRLKM